MGIEVEEEEYENGGERGAETEHAEDKKEERRNEREREGGRAKKKIEGTRLNERQRRKLRHKA